MKLSKRLKAIALIAKKYSTNGILADVGTDHAYLPCYLVENHYVEKAIATDIGKGPIQQAIATIKMCGLEEQIETRIGDGLLPILEDELDIISICGMGGSLICQILESNLDKCKFNTLILEANVNEPVLREWLIQHHFQIIDEAIVEDMKHYYEIIVAKKGKQELSKKELYFGPVLMNNPTQEFYKKWEWQKRIHEEVLTSLPQTHEKYPNVKEEYDWILECLDLKKEG